jgi:hypothetical protein
MNLNVLIDNSLFAGFMREYLPDLPQHKRFITKYPDHRLIDRESSAQFLNALALFDYLVIEAEDETVLRGYDKADVQRHLGWVKDLCARIDGITSRLISIVDEVEPTGSDISSEDAIRATIDLYGSSLAQQQGLYIDGHIPYVYADREYVYRQQFIEEMNSSGLLLDDRSLQHAMFLHRGIRLQNSSRRIDAIYQPYWYRADILSRSSPLLAFPPLSDGLLTVRLCNPASAQNEYAAALSRVYYEVLQKCCFARNNFVFPFLGGAILDIAKGDLRRALDLAIEFRVSFNDRARWKELMAAIASHEKSKAETIAAEIETDIRDAGAMTLGKATRRGEIVFERSVDLFGSIAGISYNHIAESVIHGAVSLAPETAKDWLKRQLGTIAESINRNPYQMILDRHLSAVRRANC